MGATGLEVNAVRRSFGELVAVDYSSFSVRAGQLLGFVGRNRAGRTTTMRIICGLVSAEAGRVTRKGQPIDGTVRERVDDMPEGRGPYPRTRLADQLEYSAVSPGSVA